ncbi:hypothetical protein [Micromonospora sp. NPDC005161]
MSVPQECSPDVENVRELVRRAQDLAASEHPMVAQAADRVRVVLTELLVEIDGDAVLGPWQEVC